MNNRKFFRWDGHSTAWTLLIAAVCGIDLWFVAKPQLGRIRNLNREISLEQVELNSRSHSLGTLSKAGKETGELAASAAHFNERVPSQPDLGTFLEDLARVAQRRSLQSDTIQPGEPVRTAETVALPIVFTVRGSFSGVHGLVKDIEQMPRLTHFDQFHVTADAEHPGLVKAELNLRVFYGPAPQGAKTG